jgi:hypothetical protein
MKEPEDGHLGPKHVVSRVKVKKEEQFVALLMDCVVHKRVTYWCILVLAKCSSFLNLESQDTCKDA